MMPARRDDSAHTVWLGTMVDRAMANLRTGTGVEHCPALLIVGHTGHSAPVDPLLHQPLSGAAVAACEVRRVSNRPNVGNAVIRWP